MKRRCRIFLTPVIAVASHLCVSSLGFAQSGKALEQELLHRFMLKWYESFLVNPEAVLPTHTLKYRYLEHVFQVWDFGIAGFCDGILFCPSFVVGSYPT